MPEYVFEENDSPYPTEIETNRLQLIRLSFDNFSLREIHTELSTTENPEAWEYIDLEPLETVNDTKEFIEYAEEKWDETTHAFYTVIEKESGHLTGIATLEHTDFEKLKTEIGIWLKQDYWGNGYSTERAHAFMDLAFRKLGLEYVEAHIATENTNSVKAVEKYMENVNGQRDGVLRNEYLLQEETPTDIYQRWEAEYLGARPRG